jgi:hypothetical protein
MTESEIINRCCNGQKLTKTLWTTFRGNPMVNYHLEPSGVHVSEQQALGLLARGVFEPAGDGLFETTTS